MLRLDVRVKILILLVSSVAVFLANTLWFELVVVGSIALLQLLCGRKVLSLRLLAVYAGLVLLQLLVMPEAPAWLAMLMSIVVVQFRKIFPMLMTLILIVRTTRVHELTATMTKMHLPKSATITLAVTMRYFPSLIEEWHYIHDAMRIRTIGEGHKNPIKWLALRMECYVVPLFVSAIQMSDELAAAAITRGIENPQPGTCRGYRKMKAQDYFAAALTTSYVAAAITVRVVA